MIAVRYNQGPTGSAVHRDRRRQAAAAAPKYRDTVRRQAALVAEGGPSHRMTTRVPTSSPSVTTQQPNTVDAVFLPERHATGTTAQPGCEHNALRVVVGFVGMRHDAVGERGVDRRGGQRRADDGRRAVAAMLANITQSRLTRRQFRPRNHRREGVEQMVFRLLGDFLRKRAGSGRAHIGAERGHDRAGTGGCFPENARGRNRKSHCGRRRHAENAASIHCVSHRNSALGGQDGVPRKRKVC